MSNATNFYKYCKNCFISIEKPKKKVQKHLVLSNYKEECDNCGRIERLVIDIDMERKE
jgi:hypothetical protein